MQLLSTLRIAPLQKLIPRSAPPSRRPEQHSRHITALSVHNQIPQIFPHYPKLQIMILVQVESPACRLRRASTDQLQLHRADLAQTRLPRLGLMPVAQAGNRKTWATLLNLQSWQTQMPLGFQ